jgi:hypothetical protein
MTFLEFMIRCEQYPPEGPAPDHDPPGETGSLRDEAGGEGVFFALPPLVFRGWRRGDSVPGAGQGGPGSDRLEKEPREGRDRVCAEDPRGIAAVIEIFQNDGTRVIVKARGNERPPSLSASIFKIVIKSGGLDAQ